MKNKWKILLTGGLVLLLILNMCIMLISVTKKPDQETIVETMQNESMEETLALAETHIQLDMEMKEETAAGQSDQAESAEPASTETITESAIPEAQASDSEYPYLAEFEDIITWYMDFPELKSEKEYNAFLKAQYKLWESGMEYQNVKIGSDHHLYRTDHTKEFVGAWDDVVSQRCYMTIESDNAYYYYVNVNWSDGAADNNNWSYTATYDENEQCLVYEGGSYTREHFTEDGQRQWQNIYSDGRGQIRLQDGKLYLTDYVYSDLNECVFELNPYRG